ncbi:MAG: hypothetical protein ABI746_12595 [Dermatophilaceae bacterium]
MRTHRVTRRIAATASAVLASAALALSTAVPANAAAEWPRVGGCYDGNDLPRYCGSVYNDTRGGLKLVKDWPFAKLDTVSLPSFSASQLTGLSPYEAFGAYQGYHVQGVCLPGGRSGFVTNQVGRWQIEGGPGGTCWRVGRGSSITLFD